MELEQVFESLTAVMIDDGTVRTFSHAECRFGYRDSIFKRDLKGTAIIIAVTLRLSRNAAVNTSYGAISKTLEERGIPDPGIADVSAAVIAIRSAKLPDPTVIGNAGSFFKNPEVERSLFDEIKSRYPNLPSYDLPNEKVKIPAGWMIEQCGWKGKVIGNTGTYKNQALVLVNHGGANGAEVHKLSQDIRASVVEEFGIELEGEVSII